VGIARINLMYVREPHGEVHGSRLYRDFHKYFQMKNSTNIIKS